MNNINLDIWEKPKYYYGFNPIGDYLIYSRTRDSDILENSNYEAIMNIFKEINDKYKYSFCYDFRASHFLCGWVEYILIEKDAPKEYIDKAIEIKESLESYPVLDDDNMSNKEYEAINKYWSDNMNLKERVNMCIENDISIFAARDNKHIPDKIYDIIRDYIL